MSGMMIKSVTACVVSMAAAAGVTWFGTAPSATAGEAVTDSPRHPHKADTKPKVDTKSRKAADRATSRVVVTSEAERSPTRELPPRSDGSTTRSVIQRLLRDDEREEEGKTKLHSHDGGKMHAADEEHDNSTGVRVYRLDKGDDAAPEMEADANAELERMLEQMMEQIDKRPSEERSGHSAKMGPKMPEAMPKGVMPAPMPETDGLRAFRKATPAELFAMTEEIEDSDLRDQALYAVSTYALRFDDFQAANRAVDGIEQDDLQDTARSRIAIRHGELGNVDKALGVIDSLENEDLRDIIRVQMIETLTTPVGKRGALPGY